MGGDVDREANSAETAEIRVWQMASLTGERPIYRRGDIVADLDTHYGHGEKNGPFEHDEPPGHFRALADFYGGFLNPRYVAIDRPGKFWVRVANDCPCPGPLKGTCEDCPYADLAVSESASPSSGFPAGGGVDG